MTKKVIGIDLGSTLSEVSIIENGKPTVIVNEDGGRTTPSVIGLKDGERKVGASAQRQALVNPKETIKLIKRFMGKTYDECKDSIKHVQYDVVNKDGYPRVSIDGREYSPEELSSMILGKMKKIAEDYCGTEIKDAVITCPAFYNDSERASVKMAGELAGLNVLRVIAEPTAAILASGIDMKKGGKYAVADIGGSTSDFSVADISDGVVEILATDGDVFLGGADIDKSVVNYITETFKNENGIDLSADAQALSRIFEAAEKAKIELSNSSSTDISLPYITIKDNVPMHLNMTLTKAKFEQLAYPFLKRVIECGNNAIKKAKIKNTDLDGILLVGGSCRIPKLQEMISEAYGVKLIKSANLDTCVSEGASIEGNILGGGKDDGDILLLDVTPITLGIETMGGVMTTLVPANTTIPCKKEQVFSTAQDNQTAVTIKVLQGERPMAANNKTIGIFNLDGILPARKGTPQITVTFNIDANGILNVTAKDNGTNKEQHITIETKGTLSQTEIDKIKADAKEHEKEDQAEKELADKINKGDSVIFTTERTMEEQKDKISDDDKKTLNGLIEKMKSAVKDKNGDEIDKVEKDINDVWNKLAETLYKPSNASNGTSEQKSEESSSEVNEDTKDTAQDAEFEEVK